jgi:glucose-6-phosphate isomerase
MPESGRVGFQEGFTIDFGLARVEPSPVERVSSTAQRVRADAAGPAAFLGCPDDETAISQVQAAVDAIPCRFGRVLVLGIGGSALGAQAALDALGPVRRSRVRREVRILANLDPVSVRDALDWFDPDDTLLNVITKSGSTVETLTQFLVFADRIRASRGEDGLTEGVVLTTDPERGAVRRMASRLGCETLDVPRAVGGRFSVLTPVGLFPLAAAGYDWRAMLDGARVVSRAFLDGDPAVHPTVRSAAIQHALMLSGASVRVLWAYCDRLASFGDWFCQLWAESLGKRGPGGPVGQTPVPAIGSTDQHSLLQLFMEGPPDKCLTFLTVGGPLPDLVVPDAAGLDPDLGEFTGRPVAEVFDALRKGTLAGLAEAGRPVVSIHVPELDEFAVGTLFQHFELETALTGYLLGIDPFDQPGVEAGKRFAHGILGKPGMEGFRDQAMKVLSGGRE